MEEKKIDYSRLGQERIINIRELIFECIRQWWIIAICAIVFAVLLGGFKYVKDMKSAKESVVVVQTEEKEIDIQSLVGKLSEDELIDADNVIYFKKSIVEIKDYLDNSPLMQLNPYKENVATQRYYIDNDYKVDNAGISEKDNSIDIRMAYQTYVVNEMLETLHETVLEDVDTRFIAEMILFEAYSENTFTVRVIGRDEEECNELAEQVQMLLEAYQPEVRSIIGAHELKMVDSGCYVRIDNNAINTRLTKENSIQDYQKKIETALETMNDSQKAYIDAQFAEEEKELTEEEQPVAEVKMPEVRISKKYVVVGALGGIVLAVLIILFIYLMKGTVNSAEDMQYLYNLRILGRIGKAPWFIGDKTTLEQQIQLTLVNLKTTMDLKKVQKVYVCGSCPDKLDAQVVAQIKEGVEKLQIPVEFGECFAYQPESLEQMLKCDAVILLEKERSSKYTDLANEYRICMEYQKDLLGMIVFR